MSTISDYSIKKSCLDQLTLLLFDSIGKRGKALFKPNPHTTEHLFSFIISEILSAFTTCEGYLRKQVGLMEQEHVIYINECLHFIGIAYVMYCEESIVK